MRAVVFGAEHFHKYVYGRKFIIETDHKPLVSIVKKPMEKIPPRLLNLMWKLVPYDIELHYRKGEELYIADTLSRSTYRNPDGDDVLSLGISNIDVLPVLQVSDQQLKELQQCTTEDRQLQLLIEKIKFGWPMERRNLPDDIKPYWDVRDNLTTLEGLVFKDQQIVIPKVLRKQILKDIHQSHLGIVLSTRRARDYVYWPGMSKEIKEAVQIKCDVCSQHQTNQQKETLQPVPIPELPWQTIGMDLFQDKNQHFLIVIDYYS
jgi:hypothetical protein